MQADAISTALSGFPLRSPSGPVTVTLILALALLVPLAALRLETLGVLALGVGARRVVRSLATQLAFDSGVVLDYSDPLAALLVGTAAAVTVGMCDDSRERRRLRMLFAAGERGVVEQVLHAPGQRPLEPTAIIAGYRIEEVIGRGGMGVVYRATQLALERAVAIKLIATEHAQDPVFRERFKSESTVAASIEHAERHPGVRGRRGRRPAVHRDAPRRRGRPRRRCSRRRDRSSRARAARLILQIAGALDAAHARGLVHRDVKPANVLLTLDEPEHVYLTDFGVAKRAGASTGSPTAGQWVGTLDYLAPEQIRGDAVDGGGRHLRARRASSTTA